VLNRFFLFKILFFYRDRISDHPPRQTANNDAVVRALEVVKEKHAPTPRKLPKEVGINASTTNFCLKVPA